MPATSLSGRRLHPRPQPPAHFPHSLIQVSRGFHLGRISNAGHSQSVWKSCTMARIGIPSPERTLTEVGAAAMQLPRSGR